MLVTAPWFVSYLVFSLCFFAGVVLFCLNRGLSIHDLKKLMGISLVAFVIALVLPYQDVDDLTMFQAIMGPVAFLLAFVITGVSRHREILLGKVTETEALSLTITFMYLGLTSHHELVRSIAHLVSPLALLPLLSALTDLPLNSFLRGVIALWVAFISLAVSFFQVLRMFKTSSMEAFEGMANREIVLSTAVDVFLLGGSLVLAVGYGLSVLELIPSRETTMREKEQEIKKAWRRLADTVSKHQVPKRIGLALLFLQAGPLLANQYLKWLPRDMAISISFVLVPYILRWKVDFKQ